MNWLIIYEILSYQPFRASFNSVIVPTDFERVRVRYIRLDKFAIESFSVVHLRPLVI